MLMLKFLVGFFSHVSHVYFKEVWKMSSNGSSRTGDFPALFLCMWKVFCCWEQTRILSYFGHRAILCDLLAQFLSCVLMSSSFLPNWHITWKSSVYKHEAPFLCLSYCWEEFQLFCSKALICIWITKKNSWNLVCLAFINTVQNSIFMGFFSSLGHPCEANFKPMHNLRPE